MCFCEERMVQLLCGGKYKLLLRSAWIVLTITTLIDIYAIIAYWQLAPKSLDSKPGLRLSLLLLVAVLFLYFFAALLSCFVIVKLSPRKLESLRESATSSRNRSGNGTEPSFEPPLPQSGGFRHVLPNNAALPPTYGNSQRRTGLPAIQEAHNRRAINRENTAASNRRDNCHIAKDYNLNDQLMKRQNSSHSYVEMDKVANVPKIVITGPEDSTPTYENVVSQPCQLSTRIQSNSPNSASSAVALQNKTQNLPQTYFYRSNRSPYTFVEGTNLKISPHQAKINSKNTSPNFAARPVSSGSQSYVNRSGTNQCNTDERPTLEMSIHQAKIDSRNINTSTSAKRVSSKSESYVIRSDTNQCCTDGKQTSEMSMDQQNTDKRVTNIKPTANYISSRSESCLNKSDTNKCHTHERQTLEMTMHQAKIDSRNINAYPTFKPVPSRSESNVNMTDAKQRYPDERQTSEISIHEAKIDARNINNNPTLKTVLSKSESNVNRRDANLSYVDERQTSEISKHQEKINKTNANANQTFKPIPPISETNRSRFDACQRYADERQTSEIYAHQSKIDAKNINTNHTFKPVPPRSGSNLNRSNAYQRYADDRQTSESSVHQAKIDPKIINTSHTIKPVPSRSECNANRPDINQRYADEKQTSELSMHQSKIDSRRINSNPTAISDVSSGYMASRSGAPEQFRSPSSIIVRNTNSFIIAKSQPLINPSRICTVDSLPPTSNRETQLLFKAILRSEDLFQHPSDQETVSNDPNTNDTPNTEHKEPLTHV